MKQFLYTDNLRGRGLSVFNASAGLTSQFLDRIGPYCGYKLSEDGNHADGQRYNRSFAGAGYPVLMNSAFLGREVTSRRNGNFLTHTVVSKAPLLGYAAEYFARPAFFTRALGEDEARSLEKPLPLGDVSDPGAVGRTAGDDEAKAKRAAEIVNRNLSFYRNLLQATLISLKNGGQVRLFEFGAAGGEESPLAVVWALTRLLPVNVANRVTFNTRANTFEPPRQKFVSAFEGVAFTEGSYGSVELLQFYDASRARCGAEGCNYYFYRDDPARSVRFGAYFPVVSLLLPEEGASAERILQLRKWFEDNELTGDGAAEKAISVITGENWSLGLTLVAPKPEPKPEPAPEPPKEKPAEAVPAEPQASEQSEKPQKQKPEKPQKRKKRLLAILALLLVLALAAGAVLAVFLMRGKGDPGPAGGGTFTVVLPDGTSETYRIGEEVSFAPPAARLGYRFLGYADGDTLCTDASGALLESYSVENGKTLRLSAVWEAKENAVAVVYGEGERAEFTCRTDENIVLPASVFAALGEAFPHMRVAALKLGEETVCTFEGDTAVWAEGYGMFTEGAYRTLLETGASLDLSPVMEYRAYPVVFYDYFTREELAREMLSYDAAITVDPAYTQKYFTGDYYVYLKRGDAFEKVYNTPESNRAWVGQYGKVEGYGDVLDADGEISLYLSGSVRLRFGGETVNAEFGDDIFAMSEQKVRGQPIERVNLVYIGTDQSKKAEDNRAFWETVDASNAVSVTPAFRAVFRFGFCTEGDLLSAGGNELWRAVTYLYFTNGAYRYEGAEMEDVEAALLAACPNVATKDGAVCAELVSDLWAFQTDGAYTVFEGYLLQNASRGTSVFTATGTFSGAPAGLVAAASEECVYAVYRPMAVELRFSGSQTEYSYSTAYGAALNWQSALGGATPATVWGKAFTGWLGKAAPGSGTEEVTVSFLERYGAKAESGTLAIGFEPQRRDYEFVLEVSYGSYSKRYSGLTAGSAIQFEVAKIEAAYPKERYSVSAWNENWQIGGRTFTPSANMTLSEAAFGAYVNFGSAVNYVVTLRVGAAEPAPRSYTLSYNNTVSYLEGGRLVEAEGEGFLGGLRKPTFDTAGLAARLTYGGTYEIGIPAAEGFVFAGWYAETGGTATQIAAADGVVTDFDALYALAQNGTLSLRGVFTRAEG